MNLPHTEKTLLKGKDRLQTTHPHPSGHFFSLNITQSKGIEGTKKKSSRQRDGNGRHEASHKKQKDKLTSSKEKKSGMKRRAVRTKAKSKAQATNKKHNINGNDKKCSIKEIANNTTLYSGMNAGNFKLHGKSNNITHCVEFCCQDRLCDIALIMTDRCYTVQCYSMKDCQSKSDSEDKVSDIIIAYVDNPSKKLNNGSWHTKQAEHQMYHVQISKKTVVPNPDEGNECVT